MCTADNDATFEVRSEILTENIVVVPQTFIFFKANVSQLRPPTFLNIDYDSASEQASLDIGVKTDLKVCYSYNGITEPTDQVNKHSQIFGGKPKKVKLSAKTGNFDCEWIYFSLYSSSGCVVKLRFTAQEEVKSSNTKKEDDQHKPLSEEVINRFDKMRKQMQQKFQSEKRTDLIEKNKVQFKNLDFRIKKQLNREHTM